MELIFTHCNLATMDQGRYHIIQDAGLVVSGKSITWMGPMAELDIQAHGDAKTIDCQNKWILPGFVDCHTHLIWGGSRSREFEMRLSGASYEEISRAGGGIMSTVNATRKASADQLQQAAEKRMKAMLASGVTTVEIKSGYGLNMETELKMLEVAGRLKSTMAQNVESTFLGAHALPPEFKSDSTGYVDMVINEMLPRVKDQGIATAVDVFCENIAFSREETQRIFQAATDMGFRVKLHA
ncbi:MAG: amidohydrolase family protein, partial [Desulfobacterales bacterium]|nr:amidohydrolase family protein [Desulfobacterales bacterium]